MTLKFRILSVSRLRSSSNSGHRRSAIPGIQQSAASKDWYQGTADAVRQNLRRLVESQASDVVILSGDQLYLMELGDLVDAHRAHGADLTIAVKPVTPAEAGALGIMQMDRERRIVDFVEKPKDPGVSGGPSGVNSLSSP